MKFSVLMSIYKNEQEAFFDRAMRSIWDEQILKPTEIVLVEDGPLPDDLHKVIAGWQTKLHERLKIVPIAKNVGLGKALNIGLKHCSYEIVARMDTDDIAYAERFKVQIDFLKNNPEISLVGGWISEFADDENRLISYRKVPEKHEEIVLFAQTRNPMNHVTVMFKKAVVESVGGYKHILLFEDYYLWVRLFLKNAKAYNIPAPLVKVRAGMEQLSRRHGILYACREITFQKKLLAAGFITYHRFLVNIIVRFTARILPKACLKIIYNSLRHKS